MKSTKIVIEGGHPIPTGHEAVEGKQHALRTALAGMKPGESFVWECNKAPFDAARKVKVKITTRKLSKGGYRIWRIE